MSKSFHSFDELPGHSDTGKKGNPESPIQSPSVPQSSEPAQVSVQRNHDALTAELAEIRREIDVGQRELAAIKADVDQQRQQCFQDLASTKAEVELKKRKTIDDGQRAIAAIERENERRKLRQLEEPSREFEAFKTKLEQQKRQMIAALNAEIEQQKQHMPEYRIRRLEEAERRIEQRELAVGLREAHLVEEKKKQDEQAAALTAREDAIEVMERSATGDVGKVVAEKWDELKKLSAYIEARGAKVQELQQCENAIRSLNREVAAAQAQHSRITSEFDFLSANCNSLKRSIADKQSKLRLVVGKLRQKEPEIQKVNACLDEQRKKMQAEQVLLRKVEADSQNILKREKSLLRIEQRNTELRAQFARWRKERAEREQKLKARESSLESQERALRRKSRNLDEREKRVKQLESRSPAIRSERQVERLRDKADALQVVLNGQEDFINRQRKRIKELSGKLAKAIHRSSTRSISLRPAYGSGAEIGKWMESSSGSRFELPETCVVVGFGPYDRDELITFLRSLGVSTRSPGTGSVGVMVVGHTASVEEMERQLAAREGMTLKVYSQEMMLAAIVTGRDPFETDDEQLLLAFGRGHSSLEYLRNIAFGWPSIDMEQLSDEGPEYYEGQVDESPLHKMGYYAGKTANLGAPSRRGVLKAAFGGRIPWVESDEYMDEWGKDGTTRRLWRMAHHLKMLVRAHRKMPNHEHAVDDWTEDLDWLKKQFYRPWMRFKWPSVHV